MRRKYPTGIIWEDGKPRKWVAKCGCERPMTDFFDGTNDIRVCDRHRKLFHSHQGQCKPPTCLCGRAAKWLAFEEVPGRECPHAYLECEHCLMSVRKRAIRITVHGVCINRPRTPDGTAMDLPFPSHEEQDEYSRWYNARLGLGPTGDPLS